MSESEDENENFCYFGKPLDPYDEDSFPKKRPISVEEQIATDAQGRRRFHGAFTGGFSAGFFNTVGSLEGWTPNEFKSSRADKAKTKVQKPEDFMDEEDTGEDGIAPQVVRATKDYNTSKKRKKQIFSDGPIPGEPVLHTILTSGNETIGYMLLRNLGIKDKIKTITDGKVYGCQMPQTYEISEDVNHDQYEIPKIYKDFLTKPKDNTFGLGYVGLDKNHFSLFPTYNQSGSSLIVTDKNNRKLSIRGQAFGVGAFEDEDDDIYMKDNMSKYDFELTGEKQKAQPVIVNKKMVFDMFVPSKVSLINKKTIPLPQIPHSFTGKHRVKKSRFEPIAEEAEKPGTSGINPIIRARYLGEEAEKDHTESKTLQKKNLIKEESKEDDISVTQNSPNQALTSSNNTFDVASLYLNDKFVSSTKKEDVSNILTPVEPMGTIHGTEQMREAVRMKMFGPLTRITSDWTPCSLLCKRFNVPEPFVEQPERTRTRTKNIIFEYQKHLDEETNLQPGLKIEQDEIQPPIESFDITNNVEEFPNTSAEINNQSNEHTIEIKNETTENLSIDITEKIDIEKQQDLYKAVFLSSDSESENEVPETEKEDKQLKNVISSSDSRKEEMKSAVLSDQLLPKIKPMKEGILSGVNFHKFSNPNLKVENTNNSSSDISDETKQLSKTDVPKNICDPELYGPKIPEKISDKNCEHKTVTISSSDSEEEWIEKDDSKDKRSHKKAKKHKKEKHKKHKHKKKKKRRD